MIVPAMSIEQIRKEIEKDFPILYRKTIYQSQKLFKVCSPFNEHKIVTRVYDYLSKYKNKWIYKLELTKKKSLAHFLMYAEGQKGLNAWMLFETNDPDLFFFTAHFFNRYNQRLGLNLVKPKDIMTNFLVLNNSFRIEPLKQYDNGVHKVFIVNPCGVMLGNYDQKLKTYFINTFVTNEMLHGSQVQRHAMMEAELDEFVKQTSIS